jgi:hypothetical protein
MTNNSFGHFTMPQFMDIKPVLEYLARDNQIVLAGAQYQRLLPPY